MRARRLLQSQPRSATGNVHGPVPAPAHGPSHPAKRPPTAASGVKVTVVPYGTDVPHELFGPPQLKSELTMRPGPPTDSKSGVGSPTNDAIACCFRSSATSQMAAVPMQSPSHFTNSNPSRADAVRRLTLPFRYAAVHRVPQSIRPSLLVICPPPTTCTLSTRPASWPAAAPETVQSVSATQMAASNVRGIATTQSSFDRRRTLCQPTGLWRRATASCPGRHGGGVIPSGRCPDAPYTMRLSA